MNVTKYIVATCVLFFASTLFPFLFIFNFGKPLAMRIEDTTVVNGIITMSAVVYAFTLSGVGRYRRLTGFTLNTLLGVSTVLMLFTGFFYFSEYVMFGYATLAVLTWATTSLFWNCSMWFAVVLAKSLELETR